MAGRTLADHPPRAGIVAGAHRIAVHCREIGDGLGPRGKAVRGQIAAQAIAHRELIAAQRCNAIEQPALRLFQCQHGGHGARQAPLLPPVFSIRRTCSITMPFSSALAMS